MVKTDHAALKYLPTTFQRTLRMARVYECLMRSDCSISYIKTTMKVVAETRSWRSGDATEGWGEIVLGCLGNRIRQPARGVVAKVEEELHTFRHDEELYRRFGATVRCEYEYRPRHGRSQLCRVVNGLDMDCQTRW